jgi:tetratricopeptide (TPR) repeat protein
MGSRHLRLVFAVCLAAIANTACSKDEPTTEQLLSRAGDALAAGQYDKAEKEYRAVLRRAPEDPTAQRQLGIIYYDQGQLRQAYPLLKRLAELQPDNPEIQLKLGLILLASREYAQARDAALQVLDKQPGQEQALLLLADASRTHEDIEDVRQRIQSLREKDRDRPGYHLTLAALDLRQNEQARAESELKTALNLDPKSSEAYSALGIIYWSRNDLKEADQALKTSADLAPPQSPMRMRYVDFLLKTGASAEAKKILEDINRKTPDYLPPRVYLMKIACAEHRDDDCIKLMQSVLSQDPVNFDALYQTALVSLAKGDAEKAVREFEQLGGLYGQSPQVRYQLAQAYLLNTNNATEVKRRNLTEAAEKSLDTAIQLDPHFNQAKLLLAEIKMRKGSPAAAVDLLVPVTKEQPKNVQAQYVLASAYLALQKRDQALAVYRQMTELFPQDPQPSFLIGSILLGQGQQQEARKAFEQSTAISADYLPAIERLVDLDIAAKQYATAIDRVQKLIDKDPNLAQPWGLRGKIHLAQRDLTRAEGDLLKAIDLDPKLEPAYLLLAQLYLASNRAEEAIAKLTAFVEKNKTVPALMQLGMINQGLQHFDAARDAYEKLLTVAPNFPLALNNLAVLYSEHLGQFDKAYDLAKRGREAAPNEPNLADTLGWILFKKGDYGNALRLLQDSASKLPDQPVIQYHLGMAHYMLGEEGPARIALQKAADAKADFAGKDETRQRLALLGIDIGAGNPGGRSELESYLRQRPNDPAALTRLAQVQQRDGAVDQAIKTYEKVVADEPLFAPATRQLALLFAQRSADELKAYELVTKARQAYPDDPEIAKSLGILDYRRGFYPQSSELLKEAAAKRKDDPELLYYLGRAHQQLKQYNECKETLQRALNLNLSSGLADSAKNALTDCTEMSSQ